MPVYTSSFCIHRWRPLSWLPSPPIIVAVSKFRYALFVISLPHGMVMLGFLIIWLMEVRILFYVISYV